ncbi:MAG: tRNA (guanosine(46)-N7)-methyltransferase TrmB [Proteobacteria bacterium]|nr:tRNA (guanosine(46)-N7)-methyltransferase TrmB [Pseudomonadota bacterium]
MQNKLIPSFGRRKARKLRTQSQKAYQELLPLLQLDSPQKLFDQASSDVWLEIGFGGGEHFCEQLEQNPSISMIGCEPFMNGVAHLLLLLAPEDYERVRIWHEDVRHLFGIIPSSYFSRVFILFPDPWPKKRHQRRRLITSEFINILQQKLKNSALLHIASDDSAYVEQIQAILYHHPHFVLLEGPPSADPLTWSSRPKDWPTSRYEQKALNQGKKCAYMVFQKCEISK